IPAASDSTVRASSEERKKKRHKKTRAKKSVDSTISGIVTKRERAREENEAGYAARRRRCAPKPAAQEALPAALSNEWEAAGRRHLESLVVPVSRYRCSGTRRDTRRRRGSARAQATGKRDSSNTRTGPRSAGG
ncbi:hypothetical protein IscW_ISCW006375, partial [Ixodes scapularis]